MNALLQLEGVVAGYGRGDILHGVDLELLPGSVTCLVVAPLEDQGKAFGDLVGASARSCPVAKRVPADQQVLPDAHQREKAPVLWHLHDSFGEYARRREPADLLAVEHDSPGARSQQPAERFQHG